MLSSNCRLLRFRKLIAVGGALVLLPPSLAEAQIVRRFGGGGVQVAAPFVRVNVGPGGATSVRAPFTAVNSPGRVFVGRRRRLVAQPQYATPPRNAAGRPQTPTAEPTPVDVDALPYPTASQLANMDDAVLVETLREMMGRFNFRLSRLETGEGWQAYLVLTREVLGAPGSGPDAARRDKIQTILPRYRSVADDPQYVKIATLPSFVAVFNALQEVDRRNAGRPSPRTAVTGPTLSDPKTDAGDGNPSGGATPATNEAIEEANEVLPTPQPAKVPNAARGERSILKRLKRK